MRSQGLELVDEAVGSPERGIGRAVRLATPELVVGHDPAVLAGQPFERLQVQTAAARAPVQKDERPLALAENAVADDSALDLDLSSLLFHWLSQNKRGGPEEPPHVAVSSFGPRPLRGRTCPLPRSDAWTRSSRRRRAGSLRRRCRARRTAPRTTSPFGSPSSTRHGISASGRPRTE